MKIANVAWGWTPIPEDIPHGDSLLRIADSIREIGFEGIDFLGTADALDQFYTEAACTKLGEHCRLIGLEPNVFVYQESPWNNPDPKIREKNLLSFEKAAQAAKWIGCGIVSAIVPMAYGARGWRYIPNAPAIKQSFRLPADYDYEADWDLLMQGYKQAAIIAKGYGLRMSIECFTLSMIATPHAMLKALEDIDEDNFGIQLDTNHLIAQHIDPELTMHMLGAKNIFNVHCKDHDAVTRGNIPAGAGIVDYTVLIETLRKLGYQGNLTVELEFTDNPRRYNKQAYDHLKLCLAGEY